MEECWRGAVMLRVNFSRDLDARCAMGQSGVSSREETAQESAIRRLVRVAVERLAARSPRAACGQKMDPTSPDLKVTRDPDEMKTSF